MLWKKTVIRKETLSKKNNGKREIEKLIIKRGFFEWRRNLQSYSMMMNIKNHLMEVIIFAIA